MNHNNHYYGNKSQNSSKSRKYNNDNNNGNNDNNLELQIHHQPYQQRYQQQQCRQQNIQNRHRQQHCRQQPYRPQHYRFKVDSRNLHRHDVNGDDDGDGSDGKREEVGQHQFEPDSYYNNNKTYPRNGERMRYDEHNRHYNNSNNNEKEPHFATIDYYENNGNNNMYYYNYYYEDCNPYNEKLYYNKYKRDRYEINNNTRHIRKRIRKPSVGPSPFYHLYHKLMCNIIIKRLHHLSELAPQ
ncbi:8224_t:CDS:2 [Entrophospora sp. SA101]|nr:8224_t:CDS:2 [Entrophospora sp. SA101]